MSGWTNEAGEPIMSGEAWRAEQALDASQPPYDPDDYLADDDYDDEDSDDEDDEDDEDPPAAGYHCGVCDEAFPPGVTGHTDDNPCNG